jgi:predicted enzyme related to lactoylglutathione lyase
MANQQLNAKLVICNVPTKNSAASLKFYNTLFGGQDFARSLNDKTESYFRPISQDGLTMSIGARWNDREPITCYFAVDNLNETVSQLEAAGGKVVVQPTTMPVSGPPEAVKVFHENLQAQQVQPLTTMGQFVTMTDPDGNYVGLLQLTDAMKPELQAGPAHRTLSQAQVNKHENWKQHGEPAMKKH